VYIKAHSGSRIGFHERLYSERQTQGDLGSAGGDPIDAKRTALSPDGAPQRGGPISIVAPESDTDATIGYRQ
jgi:hypothetical protein